MKIIDDRNKCLYQFKELNSESWFKDRGTQSHLYRKVSIHTAFCVQENHMRTFDEGEMCELVQVEIHIV